MKQTREKKMEQCVKTNYNFGKALVLRRYLRPLQTRLLDLGCGRGTDLLKYKRLVRSVTLVDKDPEQLALARVFEKQKKVWYPCEYAQVDVFTDQFALHFSNASYYDAVCCFNVLQYAPTAEHLNKLLDNVHAVLNTHGVLMGVVSCHDPLSDDYAQIQDKTDSHYTFCRPDKPPERHLRLDPAWLLGNTRSWTVLEWRSIPEFIDEFADCFPDLIRIYGQKAAGATPLDQLYIFVLRKK